MSRTWLSSIRIYVCHATHYTRPRTLAHNFRWRHVIPLLKDKHTLYVPELPGYGLSSIPAKADKRTVGNLIVEGLQSVFGKERKVVWIGHDRGGRVGHRMLVDNKPEHNIISAMLLDIVPTTEQWRSFANPAASVGKRELSQMVLPQLYHAKSIQPTFTGPS